MSKVLDLFSMSRKLVNAFLLASCLVVAMIRFFCSDTCLFKSVMKPVLAVLLTMVCCYAL
jgi:hypothetical protein